MPTLLERYVAVDPERRFITAAGRAARRFDLGELGTGGEAIRQLIRALLIALSDDDATHPQHSAQNKHTDDDELIEGFGALLGLALAEALGGRVFARGDCYGIQLGRFGYFDPFTAIRAAINAEEILEARELLALYLDQAGAEARGDGPIARAYTALQEALSLEGISAELEPLFPNEARLPGGAIIDLDRLIRGEGDRALIARQIARMLKSADRALSPEERARIVYPRLVGDRFLKELGEHRARLYTEPIADGLWLSFIAHYGDRARFLRADEVEDPALQRSLSIALLQRARHPLILSAEGPLLSLSSRDGLDAARILLPALHRTLRERLGAKIFISMPHRDLLLAAATPAALRAPTKSAYAHAPHRISPRVYRLAGDSILCLP